MANAIVRSVITLYKELRVPGCLTDVGAEGAARGSTVGIEEREDGSLSFWVSLDIWHGEHELPATAFPKELGVQQGEVGENKRLSAVLDFIKKQQRERTEAKVAKPSKTRRDARDRRQLLLPLGRSNCR
jgi:hypothetical protein